MPRHRRTTGQMAEFEDEEDCNRQGDKPGQRNAANARERARMRILSKAFSRLKTTLPWVPPDTKLSKLDTLRLATSYIAHLRTILTDEGSPPPVVHPLNLTWPFTIQQQSADHPSRNPEEWSPGDHRNDAGKSSLNPNLTTGYGGNSTPNSETDFDDPPSRFPTRNHHFSDRRHHYSDSLLNIG